MWTAPVSVDDFFFLCVSIRVFLFPHATKGDLRLDDVPIEGCWENLGSNISTFWWTDLLYREILGRIRSGPRFEEWEKKEHGSCLGYQVLGEQSVTDLGRICVGRSIHFLAHSSRRFLPVVPISPTPIHR